MKQRDNIKIEGHKGTWYIINETIREGRTIYLLEHEKYGEDAPCIITDSSFNILLEDVFNGFADYDEFKQS